MLKEISLSPIDMHTIEKILLNYINNPCNEVITLEIDKIVDNTKWKPFIHISLNNNKYRVELDPVIVDSPVDSNTCKISYKAYMFYLLDTSVNPSKTDLDIQLKREGTKKEINSYIEKFRLLISTINFDNYITKLFSYVEEKNKYNKESYIALLKLSLLVLWANLEKLK